MVDTSGSSSVSAASVPRTGNTENATAFALVVVANWLLAHLATEWVMPQEVAGAVQALVLAMFGAWLRYRHMCKETKP